MRKGFDFVGVGIGAAILNREGKLFLAKRGDKAKNETGKWETPGGGLEFGETVEEALKREMKEEFGIEIEIIELLNVYDHILKDEGQHWVAISYLCKLTEHTPTILEPEKCSAIGWFTLDEGEKLELSFNGMQDIKSLKDKYPRKLPDLYN